MIWWRIGGMRPARAALLAAVPALALAGCDTVRLFRDYQTAESPEVASAPYPRLVDVPPAPPPGTFTEDVPDPAQGLAARAELAPASERAVGRRNLAAAPVIPPEELSALQGRGAEARGRARDPVLTPEDRARLEAAVR